MSKKVVVFSCAHAKSEVSNERFNLLGKFLYDIKPDMVVDLGDFADLPSLASQETRYPQKVVSRSYEKDIDSANEAQDMLRHQFKKNRKKMPTWVGFEGNHEYRIKRAIMNDPRLEGERVGISFKHLNTNKWYNEYYEYEHDAPTIVDIDGVAYAHYIQTSGTKYAISGEHPAFSLLKKNACSTTVGHSHKFNYYRKSDARPRAIHGLVAGCFKGGPEDWAGQANDDWDCGVAVKHNLDNGNYDLEWVSMERIKREYGQT